MPRPPKKPGPTLVPEPEISVPQPYVDTRELCVEGLMLLEVTEEQLEEIPKIEHLFRGIGGQAKVFECLAGSEEPEARKLVALKKRLTDRQAAQVPFEAFCVAAGVTTKRMFGIISQEMMDQGEKATALLSKAMHPEVVKATIDNALRPFGENDRKMLHQNAGFVPIPKTSVVHFHGSVDARTQIQNIAVLPPVEDTVRKLNDRFNTMTVLPLALPEVEY